jgi:hypothetical protein
MQGTSKHGTGSGSFRTALDTDGLAPNVGDEPPAPGAVEMPVAENPQASHAHASLEEIDASAAAIAIGRDL